MDAFFPDEAAYRAWIAGMPGIFPCNEGASRKQSDPKQPWYSETEGPYYSSPHFLLLRVGSGTAARYCALRRVGREAEANFSWFVRSTPSCPEGQRMFAAYIWDTSTTPHSLVAGDTKGEVQARLTAYLSTGRLRRGKTLFLS